MTGKKKGFQLPPEEVARRQAIGLERAQARARASWRDWMRSTIVRLDRWARVAGGYDDVVDHEAWLAERSERTLELAALLSYRATEGFAYLAARKIAEDVRAGRAIDPIHAEDFELAVRAWRVLADVSRYDGMILVDDMLQQLSTASITAGWHDAMAWYHERSGPTREDLWGAPGTWPRGHLTDEQCDEL